MSKQQPEQKPSWATAMTSSAKPEMPEVSVKLIGGLRKDDIPNGMDYSPSNPSIPQRGNGKAKKPPADAIGTQQLEEEDEFNGLYDIPGKTSEGALIKPPYDFVVLENLVQTNNALGPCIEAMVTNCDGTGYELVPEEPAEKKVTQEFADKQHEMETSRAQEDLKAIDAPPPEDGLNRFEKAGDVVPFQRKQPQDQQAQPGQPGQPGQPQTPPPPPSRDRPPATGLPPDKLKEQNDKVARRGHEDQQFQLDRDKAIREAKQKEDEEISRLKDFFKEPYPGMSFVTMRRLLRRDIEADGNGYLEVLRNMAGELVFLRYLPAKGVRLAKLDAPVSVEKTIKRGGKDVTVNMMVRERRFAQKIGGRLTYFKEFGASRDIDKETGKWLDKGKANAQQRGNEIIHFSKIPDVSTPYGLPCWVPQTPSVVGSRKAEEHNVSYFDSGGVPPGLVIVQGGTMPEKAVEALNRHLSPSGKDKHRFAVIEAHSSGGSLDSPNNVRVTVERFGSERMQDAMFETYDDKCEKRIRGAFRLPPIFVGRAGDYSFATAFASYTVAEAQVFRPERDEFDEFINLRIMPEIGGEGFCFRSLPLAVKDAALQLQGIQIAQGASGIGPEEVVDAINEVTNLALEFDAEHAKQQANQMQSFMSGAGEGGDPGWPGAGGGGGGAPGDKFGRPGGGPQAGTDRPDRGAEAKDAMPGKQPPAAGGKRAAGFQKSAGLAALAIEAAHALQKRDGIALQDCSRLVGDLGWADQRLFKTMLAAQFIPNMEIDPEGVSELAGCALAVMAANHKPRR